MRLQAYGTCRAVSDCELLDEFGDAAVVRVVVQELRKNADGTYSLIDNPLFIDVHTSIKYVTNMLKPVRKGDTIIVCGRLKNGYDKANRPVAFIEASDVAFVSKQADKQPFQKQQAQSADPDGLPPLPENLGSFEQADLSALPDVTR